MESSAITLVPVSTLLTSLLSCPPAIAPASSAASDIPSGQRLCRSHVTPGDPGAGAGQDPGPS